MTDLSLVWFQSAACYFRDGLVLLTLREETILLAHAENRLCMRYSCFASKSKQQLRSSIAQIYHKQQQLEQEILSQSSNPQLIENNNTYRYVAYNISSRYHSEQLNKKLTNLLI